MRILVMLVALMMLAGCATQTPFVRANVTSFSDATALGSDPKTFRFERAPEQRDSLEHGAYEALVAEQLALHGFQRADDARYVVSMIYQIELAEVTVRETEWIDEPRMFWYGPVRWRTGRRVVYGWGYDPRMAWVSTPVSYNATRQISRRELRVEIRDQLGLRKVFEGNARSEGTLLDLNPVMPYLVRALFDGFPGQHAVTRVVDVPIDPVPADAAPGAAP